MIEFWITELKSEEEQFSVPSSVGTWDFNRRDDYASLLSKVEEGQCAPTYYAFNGAITHATSDHDFMVATGELIDICLILSFLTAACVTPKGNTPQSDATFLALGDSFIRPRAISGFMPLATNHSMAGYFSRGLPAIGSSFKARRMRLFLSHWISGLTCFSLEDLFLSVGIQMDIVKQCEIVASGKALHYYDGMTAASSRYSIQPLSREYCNMRNDLVHEGVLSGKHFKRKNKAQCSQVVASSLNWIDRYVAAVLSIGVSQSLPARWNGKHLEHGLPALSLYL